MPLVQIVQGMLDDNSVISDNIVDRAITINKLSLDVGVFSLSGINALASLSATSLSAAQLTVSAGTSAVPAISPVGDTNTGIYFPSADTIAVATSGTEAMRIDSSRNVGIGLTPTARNNTRLQIVDGIGFPATQVPSSDPNTLDDYEEGTWTPNLTDVTVGNGTFAVAQYIKIGRQVYVGFNFTFGSTTTVAASSVINISGLPFANDSNGVGSAYLFDSGTGAYTLPAVLPSSTALTFRIARGVTNGTDQITGSSPFTWAVNDRINFAGVYSTSS